MDKNRTGGFPGIDKVKQPSVGLPDRWLLYNVSSAVDSYRQPGGEMAAFFWLLGGYVWVLS
jgi:hypothetical protein